MVRKLVFCTVLILSSILSEAAQDPSIPDLSGWSLKNHQNIEIKTSDREGIFLGVELEYVNPADNKDFILVVCRFNAFSSIRGNVKNRDSVGIEFDRRTGMEKEALNRSYQNCDNVVFIKYKLAYDAKTKELIFQPPVESWLFSHQGVWRYMVNDFVNDNGSKSIRREDVFDSVRDNPKKKLIVGKKFVLDGEFNILGVDPDLLQDNQPKEK